jgi:hypothetical protein
MPTYDGGMSGVANEHDLVVFMHDFLERRVSDVAHADGLLGEADELAWSDVLIRGHICEMEDHSLGSQPV